MNLETVFAGLRLTSPLLVGSGPLDSTAVARECQEAGAGMIVMHSLFEEQFVAECAQQHWSMEHGSGPDEMEALTEIITGEGGSYVLSPDEYYQRIGELKRSVNIPICGSINGTSPGNWVLYAQAMQRAGADAIELNLYDPVMDPQVTAGQIEARQLEVARIVRRSVQVPLAVKLSPFYTSVAHLARQFDDIGVDGIVLFNRFYQPDFDITGADLRVARTLRFSTPDELPLRLRWAAALHGRIKARIAITGGVHTGGDAIKAILAGASAVQVVSAIMQQGVKHLTTMRQEMEAWMGGRGIGNLREIEGALSLERVPSREAFDRANYVGILRAEALSRGVT